MDTVYHLITLNHSGFGLMFEKQFRIHVNLNFEMKSISGLK